MGDNECWNEGFSIRLNFLSHSLCYANNFLISGSIQSHYSLIVVLIDIMWLDGCITMTQFQYISHSYIVIDFLLLITDSYLLFFHTVLCLSASNFFWIRYQLNRSMGLILSLLQTLQFFFVFFREFIKSWVQFQILYSHLRRVNSIMVV